MSNSDCIMFKHDGQLSTAKDYYASGYGAPTLDAQQDLTFQVKSVEAGYSTVEARRKLDTGDAKDFVIPLDSEFKGAYAYNSNSNVVTKKHTVRGAAVFRLTESDSAAWLLSVTSAFVVANLLF